MKYFTLSTCAILAGTVAANNDKYTSVKCEPDDACYKAVDDAVQQAAAAQQDPKNMLRMLGPASNAPLEVGKPIKLEGTTVAQAFSLDFNSQIGADGATDAPQQMLRFGFKFRWPVINNYGCWCYGGDMWPGARDWTGFGPTMDDYDDACKAHHMGFDCIVADAKAEGETCNPTETTYSLLVTPQWDGSYQIECDDAIESQWCESRVCMVDLRFIARHHKLEKEQIPDYEAFGHPGNHGHNTPGSGFDTQVCEIPKGPKGGGPPTVQVCCGDYPYRIWYDINNTRNIRCCEYKDQAVIEDYGFSLNVGELYNGLTKECCASGVQPVGSSGC